MTKNELIDKLNKIEGNPIILLDDTREGYALLESVEEDFVHKCKKTVDYKMDYVSNTEYENSDFYVYDYQKEAKSAIILRISGSLFDE